MPEISPARAIAALARLTVPQLRRRYAELFGEETPANNRPWLVKRIAWRLQARAEGGLSERALQRAAELADDAALRLNPPPERQSGEPAQVATVPFRAFGRLPPAGTILTRPYKGQTLQVKVLPEGFEYQGQVYRSLSAVAKAVTGSHCNGFHFFRLTNSGGAA